jgi:hypothetical protein
MIRLHNSHKLVTKEDPYHIHKTLGIICLVNYGYRYYLLFTRGTMDLNNSTAAYLVVAHAALSCTSMIYRIPKIRNRTGPMIYPEYRIHSILFALRSVVCFFLVYYQYSIVYRFAACYATMVLADVVTSRYNTDTDIANATTTMRNMPFDSQIVEEDRRQIIQMQSSQQINATLFMLGNLDSCFSPMFAIQIAAFLMTLVRKNIIHPTMWHLIYNLSLWINVFCYNSLPIRYMILHPVLFQIFYYWRFTGDQSVPKLFVGNKYVGWTIVFATFYVCNEKITDEYNNMEKDIDAEVSIYNMMIRYAFITIYLVSHIYKSKGLLVSFRRKTD